VLSFVVLCSVAPCIFNNVCLSKSSSALCCQSCSRAAICICYVSKFQHPRGPRSSVLQPNTFVHCTSALADCSFPFASIHSRTFSVIGLRWYQELLMVWVWETVIERASTVKNITRTRKTSMTSLETGKRYEPFQVIRWQELDQTLRGEVSMQDLISYRGRHFRTQQHYYAELSITHRASKLLPYNTRTRVDLPKTHVHIITSTRPTTQRLR
jgi:hypothetical protein